MTYQTVRTGLREQMVTVALAGVLVALVALAWSAVPDEISSDGKALIITVALAACAVYVVASLAATVPVTWVIVLAAFTSGLPPAFGIPPFTTVYIGALIVSLQLVLGAASWMTESACKGSRFLALGGFFALHYTFSLGGLIWAVNGGGVSVYMTAPLLALFVAYAASARFSRFVERTGEAEDARLREECRKAAMQP